MVYGIRKTPDQKKELYLTKFSFISYLRHFDNIDKGNAKQHQDQQHSPDLKRKNRNDLTIVHEQHSLQQFHFHQYDLVEFFSVLVPVDST
jgi:hypothetical protein